MSKIVNSCTLKIRGVSSETVKARKQEKDH